MFVCHPHIFGEELQGVVVVFSHFNIGFFLLSFKSLFWMQVVYQVCAIQIFSSNFWLVFHCLNSILCRMEVFNGDETQFINVIPLSLNVWKVL